MPPSHKKNKRVDPPALIAARKKAAEELGLQWREPPKGKKPRKGHIAPPGEGFPPREDPSRPKVAFDFNLDFNGKGIWGACACDGKTLVAVSGETVARYSLSELEESFLQSPSVEEEAAVEELGRILNNFLDNLSERDEMIFFCRYYYADKIQSIAYMLGISESTVKRELARLRNELREKLEQEGYTV